MPAMPDTANPWATLDDLLGIEIAAVDPGQGIGAVAFYGRCSTEDNQDPKTSRNWQLSNATKFVAPFDGVVSSQFFDIGQSRSVPWDRRREASRLLAALKDPKRGWSTVVVGEGTRCWFGNQFSLIAPRFAAYGVELWVPELGGKYDPRNPSHKMLMSVLGGMSESERQHVQARVRAAMDAQVVNEGRHQGGRAPFGYVTVNAGVHPNPRKAAEGGRLRVLEIEDWSAEVVRRIFAAYLTGNGDRAIAGMLNRDGVPCPSARRPDQNSHRIADGWQSSTVRSILDNPRYTGYAIFGRWARQETLIDPDDVAAGHVIKFRRATPQKIVRSREAAHPAVVSVAEFTQAQLLRRTKAAGGLATARKSVRGGRSTAREYLLRGLVRCGVCDRRMQGATIRAGAYYRCTTRTMAPGAAAVADHPATVNLREDQVIELINGWIGGLFAPENLDETVATLVGDQSGLTAPGGAEMEDARARHTDAETRLRRYREAIGAGVDPTALVEAINQAQAERAAAQAQISGAATGGTLDIAEVYAMIDSIGDIAETLKEAKPAALARLYRELDLSMRYVPGERAVYMRARPRVDSACVRGGTCAQTRRLTERNRGGADTQKPTLRRSWGDGEAPRMRCGGRGGTCSGGRRRGAPLAGLGAARTTTAGNRSCPVRLTCAAVASGRLTLSTNDSGLGVESRRGGTGSSIEIRTLRSLAMGPHAFQIWRLIHNLPGDHAASALTCEDVTGFRGCE